MKTTGPLRVELPLDVRQRLMDEAAAEGVPVGTFLRRLIVTRDAKKHGATGSTATKGK